MRNFQLVERREFRLLRNAHRALPLNIRVPSHRTDPRARLADVAAQEQQVGQHLDCFHSISMLGESHTVNTDDGLGAQVLQRRRAQIVARKTRAPFDLFPSAATWVRREFLEPLGAM
jgi:hypothetical protein